ncbi:hypothetical protein [Geosporobacter ferrireducens]|uniref:Uncharacterized protein n=1 Tax=Geosporobacter ferrireducens TaxID=1424294 RepID=A0A1D8GB92_9FIRM|nr:hypothetical protein [Geosporobacter ferrireducens]AOT68170.1 hypothetical protein Gferi_00375 [Geosporobacter ferrireducens]MTI54220.1 hypothetical protein [Geosporobacter ferrireducens]
MKPKSHPSNQGSVLAVVLIFFAILSTLGAALLDLSTINYKMKLVSQHHKHAFYLAEAAIEEAYALIANEIETTLHAISVDEINNVQWKQQYITKLNEQLLPLLQNHTYTHLDTVHSETPPMVTLLSFESFRNHYEPCKILLESTATYYRVFHDQKARIEIDVPNNPQHLTAINPESLIRIIYLPIE